MSLDIGMWCVDPRQPHLAYLYCDECEQRSRSVKVPTEAQKAVNPSVPMYPTPPRGWEDGCPRCDR